MKGKPSQKCITVKGEPRGIKENTPRVRREEVRGRHLYGHLRANGGKKGPTKKDLGLRFNLE